METLAYTFAFDLGGDETQAVLLARELLKDVRKSGLKPPFSQALLRRLALAEWTRRDRPRPRRLESKDPKETAILLFFLNAWGVTYEDLGVALSVSEDRSRHLVHKARMERIATLTRIPIPRHACRRPRELLSDFRERLLAEPLAEDVSQHLGECRECSVLDLHLQTLLNSEAMPMIAPPADLSGDGNPRPTLSLSLDGVSRGKRAAGVVFLALGVAMSAVQLHPGLNASASAQMDRLSASLVRWRNRGERLVEDMRVLRALAVGTVEGRTEELSQTLDDYVNSGNPIQTDTGENKPAADAVLDWRDTKATPQEKTSPGAVRGSPSPSQP